MHLQKPRQINLASNPLQKMFLYFDILTWLPTVPYCFLTKINIWPWLYIKGLDCDCCMLWYALPYLLTIWSNSSLYNFFWYWSHMLIDFVLRSSNKSFSNNRFFIIMCWIYFIFFWPWLNWSIVKITTFVCSMAWLI